MQKIRVPLLLALSISISHLSFALDENQESLPHDSSIFETKIKNREKASSPLMMFEFEPVEEKDSRSTDRTSISQNQTEQNRRNFEPVIAPDINGTELRADPSKQASFSEEEVIRAVETLNNPNPDLESIISCLDQMKGPPDSIQTMRFLKCLNVVDTHNAISSLFAVNSSLTLSSGILILNNTEVPFEFSIPSDDPSENLKTVRSPVILTGIKNNAVSSTLAPTRIPNAEENKQVKKYIYKAFEDYYGPEVANTCLSEFMKDEENENPLTFQKLQLIFGKLDDLKGDEEAASPLQEKINSSMPPSVRFDQPFRLSGPNERDKKALEAYFEAKRLYSHSQEKFPQALSLSAEALGLTALVTGSAAGAWLTSNKATTLLTTTLSSRLGDTPSFLISTLISMVAGHTTVKLAGGSLPRSDSSAFATLCSFPFLAVTFFRTIFRTSKQPLYFPAFLNNSSSIILATRVAGFYFDPRVPAAKAWSILNDFWNREKFLGDAITFLKSSEQQYEGVLDHLPALFDHSSEELQHALGHAIEGLPQHNTITEDAGLNPLLTLTQLHRVVSQYIQERLDAREILIKDLEQKFTASFTDSSNWLTASKSHED